MEYRKNPEYGKSKCFRCLLSTDREEAGIFIGINKVISRALDTNDGTLLYPCKVLNRFACPYDDKVITGDKKDMRGDDNQNKSPNVDYLFHLSELAFAVELALARAQEEDSVFMIKNAQDVYRVLTDKEALEKVLQQGLKDEHKRYKDEIVEFLLNMKNRTKVNDLTLYPC
jgi:hypothetical protein